MGKKRDKEMLMSHEGHNQQTKILHLPLSASDASGSESNDAIQTSMGHNLSDQDDRSDRLVMPSHFQNTSTKFTLSSSSLTSPKPVKRRYRRRNKYEEEDDEDDDLLNGSKKRKRRGRKSNVGRKRVKKVQFSVKVCDDNNGELNGGRITKKLVRINNDADNVHHEKSTKKSLNKPVERYDLNCLFKTQEDFEQKLPSDLLLQIFQIVLKDIPDRLQTLLK